MLSLQAQAYLYRQMAALARSGSNPGLALDTTGHCPAWGIRRKLRRLAGLLEGALPISQAFQEAGIVPALHCSLMAVGQATGRLDNSFLLLAQDAERKLALRNHLKQELWPSKLTLIAALPFAAGLVHSGHGLSTGQVILLCLLFAFTGVLLTEFVITRINGFSNPVMERLVARLPLLGAVAAGLAEGRFARSFAALHAAGVEIVPSLRTAAAASGSSILTNRVRTALPSIERGENITRALTQAKALSPEILNVLDTGEATGRIDTLMEYAAGTCEEDAGRRLRQLCIILGLIALLIVAAIIFLIASSVFNPGFLR